MLAGCVEFVQKPAWFEEDINVKKEIEDIQKKQKEVFRDLGSYYYIWDQAVVDRVEVPSQIVGGAYIPRHEDYVIVNPGGFRFKKHYDKRKNIGEDINSTPESNDGRKSERIVLKVYKTGVTDVGVSASVYKNRVLFMMHDPEVEEIANGGSLKIGKNLYTFRFAAGGSVVVAFVDKEELVEERIEPDMVFVTSDGYIIEPVTGGEK
jgi:hypothetical protein